MTPSPRAAAFDVGATAVTIATDVVVRSQPRVSADSVIFKPYLPEGTELAVLGGPVSASGYTWYRVAPLSFTLNGATEGWVAIASRGGDPWVEPKAAPAGLEVVQASASRGTVSAAKAKGAATSINALGIDLYRRLVADPTLGVHNAVFSPTSIAIALAMARAGARGQTATQMDAVLHASGWDALGAGLDSLDQSLASLDGTWQDDEGTQHLLSLRLSNGAFAQRGWPIEQTYLAAIAAAFGAGLGLTDFMADPEGARQAINAWVKARTNGRIPELLAPGVIKELTRLVLVNTIYLKANWQQEFLKGWTKAASFARADGTKVSVQTMRLIGHQSIPYAHGSGWQATELPYLGAAGTSPLAMSIIYPDDLKTFEAGFTTAKLAGIIAALEQQKKAQQTVTFAGTPDMMDCGTYPYSLELFMPKFGIDTPTDLKQVLSGLGMPLAFDRDRADFTGITASDRLFISSVIHQANIDVDEKGTEAAAATAVVMRAGGCTGPEPGKAITLRLERPFLFLVRDTTTGAVLFMGRVADPSVRD